MDTHTPGPLKTNGSTLVGDGYNIGSVNAHRTNEGMCNARLIAAAPDLLEALQRYYSTDWQHRYEDSETTKTRAMARAAIAKATGV